MLPVRSVLTEHNSAGMKDFFFSVWFFLLSSKFYSLLLYSDHWVRFKITVQIYFGVALPASLVQGE